MYKRLTRLTAYIGARPRLAAPAFGLLGAFGFRHPCLADWVAWCGRSGLAGLAQRDAEAGFLLGWLFGVAHLTLANSWIATAFTYQAEMPPTLGWAAVPLLSCYLAVYPTLATLAAKWLAQGLEKVAGEGGIARFGVLLAACWIVTEWLRSWVFTGYPWPPLGLMLLGGYDTPGVAAVLPVTGTYALSGVIVLIATVFAVDFRARRWVNAGLLAAILTLAMVVSEIRQVRKEARYPTRSSSRTFRRNSATIRVISKSISRNWRASPCRATMNRVSCCGPKRRCRTICAMAIRNAITSK